MVLRPPVSGKKSKRLEQKNKHPQGMTRKLPSNNHNADILDRPIQNKTKTQNCPPPKKPQYLNSHRQNMENRALIKEKAAMNQTTRSEN